MEGDGGKGLVEGGVVGREAVGWMRCGGKSGGMIVVEIV